jgi:hypothetical protein
MASQNQQQYSVTFAEFFVHRWTAVLPNISKETKLHLRPKLGIMLEWVFIFCESKPSVISTGKKEKEIG